MKRAALATLSIFAFTTAACGHAPAARVASPSPIASAPRAIPVAVAEPASVVEGAVTTASMRGMQIIVKRTPGTEFVAAQLIIRGGARNLTSENAGIEHVALRVATSGGTQSLSKSAYSRKLASLGATINSEARCDSSVLLTKAPSASWDALFPTFVETFLAPALPASELEVAKQRQLTALRHELEDGDGRLTFSMRRVLFAGHPFANRPIGTVETVSALNANDVAQHLAKLRDTNRLVLVVVGDVDAEHVIAQAKGAFASVAQGPYVESPVPPLHLGANHVSGDAFALPTNYIQSFFAGPTWRDPDFVPMRVGMWLLRERLFDEVRTKRNLSYAPGAYFSTAIGTPYGALYVTAVDPNPTMKVIFDEAQRLRTETISAADLAGAKSVYLSRTLQAHETVDGQAEDIGEAIVLGGDWHLVSTFADRVRATTADDIRKAANKWLANVQTVIVGNPTKLEAKIVGAE